jgi:hypothetical protein
LPKFLSQAFNFQHGLHPRVKFLACHIGLRVAFAMARVSRTMINAESVR